PAALKGKNFISTWTAFDNYGQVIINQAQSASMLAMEKGVIDPIEFTWGQFAIPFNFTDANEAMQFLFGTNFTNSTNRYKVSLMKWDNVVKPQFLTLNSTSLFTAGDYVILNLDSGSAG